MGAFSDFFDFISDDGIFDEEDFDFETGEFVEGTGGAGFWDAIGGGLGDIFDYFTNDSQGQVLGSVLGSMILNQSGIMDPKIPQVGYQGGIPEYQAVRRQTNPYDPDRRPGSGGRRYFTDLEYTSTGKNMGKMRVQIVEVRITMFLHPNQQMNLRWICHLTKIIILRGVALRV